MPCWLRAVSVREALRYRPCAAAGAGPAACRFAAGGRADPENLGALAGFSRSTVSVAEIGRQPRAREFWAACDKPGRTDRGAGTSNAPIPQQPARPALTGHSGRTWGLLLRLRIVSGAPDCRPGTVGSRGTTTQDTRRPISSRHRRTPRPTGKICRDGRAVPERPARRHPPGRSGRHPAPASPRHGGTCPATARPGPRA